MDPLSLMSLAQMGMGFGQGIGAGMAGDSGGWGNAFQGSVLGGYLTGKSQKKKKKKAQARFKRALNMTQSIQGRNLQQQEALARQATGQELAGFDAARRETSRLGRGAKRSALDRESQLGARASQNMASRGLGSTTVGANLQRGIASDTNRLMADVDEGMAGQFGNLALGRAGVQSAGTQRLADIGGQRAGLETQLGQMRLLGGATLGSTGSFDPGSWQGNYMPDMSGMQEGFGSMMGGMGGGAGGQMGGMDPRMLQYLFGSGGGFAGGGMNLNTFAGG